MDEWDDFLAKRSASAAELDDAPVSQPKEVENVDLGEYVDNAEVFIQVSRGESLTHMREGIFINQPSVPSHPRPPLKQPQRLPASSLPVANSLSDLAKLLPGHPRLSHPLGQMMPQSRDSIKSLLSNTVELDSLALFFYGAVKDVKVDSDCKIDYAEAVEFKKTLIGQSLLDESAPGRPDEPLSFDESHLFLSLENLRLLCGAIPPHGKNPFLIPFTVNEAGQVDLTSPALVSDLASGTTVEALTRLYRQRLEAKVSAIQFTTKVFIGETHKITVSGRRPLFNVNLAFRGAAHPDASYSNSSLENLFSRQPNYHAIVEAESGLVQDLKIYVPRLDLQAKIFNLLSLLADRLQKLAANKQYFLLHMAGTPNLKILELTSENGSFDCNLFKF